MGIVLLAACRIAETPQGERRVGALGLGLDGSLPLERFRTIDLTHPFDARTVYWPTAPSGFELDTLAAGETPSGWYAANAFAAPEHGGTHLDAPVHFYRRGSAVDELPLERLIGPGVVIDISEQAGADPDYVLTRADVLAWEEEHGRIEEGAIVMLRTGWARFWPDAERYLGVRQDADSLELHFPSYGADAARLLVEERGVAALGGDVASIDAGSSTTFEVHRIAAAAGVPGLENLASLGGLPPTGFTVIALPMKIAGGTGAPVRAIALVPDTGR
ncbi:MAG: cyclase family protein [Longimicrobiales bacterium]